MPDPCLYTAEKSKTQVIPILLADFRAHEYFANPWQGKTFFLSYILASRLLRGQPTVYREDDDNCYLFNEGPRGKRVDMEFLFNLGTDEKKALWILTDEALVKAPWARLSSPWFVVLGATPGRVEASRRWLKDRNPGSRIMKNWGWHEVFAAF